MSIVTRFAPSPTGYLHVGSVRTALYSWLYAKKKRGKFILRIEDTDIERSTKESMQAILDGMNWLGLKWDEGPIFQSEHFKRYKAIIDQLLLTGKAYKCYCSKERLTELRERQITAKIKPRYDGMCRNKANDEINNKNYVIRFKNPEDGIVEFNDLVHGNVRFQNSELDDLILVRSDGVPTYNLTVVVDDMDMGVTHVIRGNDHVNNTPRQVNILHALAAPIPYYVHVPMILGNDGKRLSKRHGAVSVLQYREDGFLPEAILNYLVRLGWSHGDKEIFSQSEMIEYFDLQHISKAASAFDTEKLLWLNQHYIRTSDIDTICAELIWHMDKLDIDTSNGPPLPDLVFAQRDRCKTIKEMAEKSIYFYLPEIKLDKTLAVKYLTESGLNILQELKIALTVLTEEDWQKEKIHTAIHDVVHKLKLGFGKVAQPLRFAVTGGNVSPSIDITLQLLGRKITLERLDAILLQKLVDKTGSAT